MLKKILNPDLYHGKNKKKNFFEGWYYKIIDKDNQHSLAFIPGITKGKISENGHSFLQVLDGIHQKTHYIRYSKDSFKAKDNEFYIELEKNSFSLHEMKLNHFDENVQIIGSLKFINIVKWPDSILNPGSMGFYNYLFFMECYTQVTCLDGEVIGKILINNEEIDFTGGRIYIEKNWGSKFPESYVWVQCNGFNNISSSVTASIGRIPFLFTRFTGFIVSIYHNGKFYKFSTINRSKMKITYRGNNVIMSFKKDNIQLNIETLCEDDEFLDIIGPSKGMMNLDVKESITSDVRVELIDLYQEVMLFQAISRNSGVEFLGKL